MQSIGLNFLPKSRIDKLYWFKIHGVVTNFKPITRGGGRKRLHGLPKFKFSAKFPIGLHVILQIQIKKFENDCYIM